jgi:hypothetical protein
MIFFRRIYWKYLVVLSIFGSHHMWGWKATNGLASCEWCLEKWHRVVSTCSTFWFSGCWKVGRVAGMVVIWEDLLTHLYDKQGDGKSFIRQESSGADQYRIKLHVRLFTGLWDNRPMYCEVARDLTLKGRNFWWILGQLGGVLGGAALFLSAAT